MVAPTHDKLDDVLDVAVSVLDDLADCESSQDTRIARLARYVAGHLGGPPYSVMTVNAVSRADLCPVPSCESGSGVRCLWKLGTVFGTGTRDNSEWPKGGLSKGEAETLVVALLRLMEVA
mgnify:FL=1